MATASELLTQVETAISNCLTAQSYTVSGRTKIMAQLKELRDFRQQLLDEIANGANSSGSMVTLLKLEDVTA